jgi:transcriptional regulator with XRE-family HTH domain
MNGQIMAAMRSARRFSPARLAEARRARGLRQRDVSAAIDRALRHYQRIESGHVNPTAVQLGQLADLLDVTIDGLYAIAEEEGSTRSDG